MKTLPCEMAGVKTLVVPEDYLNGKILAHNIVDTETGELLANANDSYNFV